MTMKIITYLSFLIFAVNLMAVPTSELSKRDRLVIEGRIIAIGPSPGYGSGGVLAYQLVKYHVNHICEGDYKGEEILVDHLLSAADDLKDLKVGDTVCIGVTKSKQMTSLWIDGVLRHESDKAEAYYIALDVFIRNCRCSRPGRL